MERILDSHWLSAVITDCNCNRSANKSNHPMQSPLYSSRNPGHVIILFSSLTLCLPSDIRPEFLSKILWVLNISSAYFLDPDNLILIRLSRLTMIRQPWAYKCDIALYNESFACKGESVQELLFPAWRACGAFVNYNFIINIMFKLQNMNTYKMRRKLA
jgi:hypothetical protein